MFNVNDIVVVKSEKDFEKDILNGLCYKTDTGSIYYRNDRDQIPFSSAMKSFMIRNLLQLIIQMIARFIYILMKMIQMMQLDIHSL